MGILTFISGIMIRHPAPNPAYSLPPDQLVPSADTDSMLDVAPDIPAEINDRYFTKLLSILRVCVNNMWVLYGNNFSSSLIILPTVILGIWSLLTIIFPDFRSEPIFYLLNHSPQSS